MRKRQYGNGWMTQFVPLCRGEVRRLEERQKIEQAGINGNSVQKYIEGTENSSLRQQYAPGYFIIGLFGLPNILYIA